MNVISFSLFRSPSPNAVDGGGINGKGGGGPGKGPGGGGPGGTGLDRVGSPTEDASSNKHLTEAEIQVTCMRKSCI